LRPFATRTRRPRHRPGCRHHDGRTTRTRSARSSADADSPTWTPPDFLDYAGTELVLIGASPDVTRELGLSLHPRRETEQSADIFTVLGMERDLHPVEPLLTGEWK
jgi:hypothetical protein